MNDRDRTKPVSRSSSTDAGSAATPKPPRRRAASSKVDADAASSARARADERAAKAIAEHRARLLAEKDANAPTPRPPRARRPPAPKPASAPPATAKAAETTAASPPARAPISPPRRVDATPPPRVPIASRPAAAARRPETAITPAEMAPTPTTPARPARDAEDNSLPSFLRPPTPTASTPSAHEPRPADASPRSTRLIEAVLRAAPESMRDALRNDLVLMRLDRPVGALLLLWPTWWALWFAAGDFPPIATLIIFTLGVFVMRSAGCVINDYADHGWLDTHVERTRGRPMAAGRVSKRHALTLFAGLLALAFVLVLFTNRMTIELSFVGAALAAVYPFTKRVTHLAQVVLGAAFGWSIPMAFAAVTGSLPPLCWLLFLANVLFSTVYDTEYAMVDREDDLRVGAKSTAILFGDADRAIVGVLMATFVFAMVLAGTRASIGWPYFAGVAVATALFGRQQWLMRDRSRAHCFAAFRNNNAVGLALWVGLVVALAIR